MSFMLKSDEAFTLFLDSGGSGSAREDAEAKAGELGKTYPGAIETAPSVWIYEITKTGLAPQLTPQGTKYYEDDDLNKP